MAENAQQVRIYAVIERYVENAPYVIKGTTYICDKFACILIDPGVIFSFI